MGALGSFTSLLRSIACCPLLVLSTLYYSAAAIILALRGRRPEDVHRAYLGFARFCIRIANTRLIIHGAELGGTEAYVVVSNHESNWDSPILIAAFPQLCARFVAKKQLMQIPVFGHALRVSGNIMVDRDRRGTDLRRIEEQMSVRAPSVSILFFAEGRRTRDGSLQEFKLGAFATALAFRLPILPVAVAGSRRIWPPGGLRIRSGPVAIEVGAPIPVDGLEFADRKALRDQTREVVGKLRARARQRLRDMGVDPGGID